MFACLYVPDFSVQATLLTETPDTRNVLRQSPTVVLDGPPNLLKVIALNEPARKVGIAVGMTKMQVETCGGVLLRKRSSEQEAHAQDELLECAKAFSPRVESVTPGVAILDLTGTEKLFGSPENTVNNICNHSLERGFHLQVAIASTPDTAMYAARGFLSNAVIPRGQEAARLAPLSVALLPMTPEMQETVDSWGIRTFGALAALPEVALTERLGQEALSLQRLARGQTRRTLVPIAETESFVESHEFEHHVDSLEPLAFMLNRLLQQACARLVSLALATNELRLRLDLSVRQYQNRNNDEQYQHDWKFPVPTQDKNVLLSLVRLELERNAFIAPIKKLTIEVLPIKPRRAQGNLFAPPSPEAEQLEITLARLRGVVGSVEVGGVDCVGSPYLLDTHKPGAFGVQAFSSAEATTSIATFNPVIALRAFRPVLETSVELTGDEPHFVSFGRKYRRVLAASGPWCSSGSWWNNTWAREEWDVALKTTAGIGFYRIYRDCIREQWFVEGLFD